MRFILTLDFLQGENGFPENIYGQKDDFRVGTLYIPLSQYVCYLDLLRNESDVFCRFEIEPPYNHQLFCKKQPVGAGDEISAQPVYSTESDLP
jgi:hypothetical protein